MPTSERQKRANRQNAKRSTGPRTRRGKDVVKYNALQHGLLARAALLPGEDSAPFEEMREAITAHFAPEGEMEQMLVDLIVSYLWRLRRVAQVESGIYAKPIHRAEAERLRQEGKGLTVTVEEWKGIEKYYEENPPPEEITIDEDEDILAKAEEAEGHLRSETVQLGEAFVTDAARYNAFTRLSRYESGIQRSLWRVVNELRAVQESRGVRPLAPAAAALTEG
jgi:hypothetical protein